MGRCMPWEVISRPGAVLISFERRIIALWGGYEPSRGLLRDQAVDPRMVVWPTIMTGEAPNRSG